MKGVSVAMDKKESTNKLIMHLNSIINHEVEKPYTEMDADLVEACVELSLELQGKNYTLSNEELEEKVRKIPFVDTKEFLNAAQKKRKKINKRKILLIAAIVAILCAILMVMSSGRFVEYWHSVMNEKFGSVFNVPVGEEYSEGDAEFTYNGKNIIYKDIETFFEKENYNVLLPAELNNEINIIDIMVTKPDNTIVVSFDSVITAYEIYFDATIPQIVKDTAETYITTNNLVCYIERMQDIGMVQIHFEYNGNYYNISGTDEQILLGVIENLEEYK